jgi:natural product biosynthesis luciferase-like monooxygenase protein
MNHDELNGIAIIGMAGRFPGARTVAEFWQNVQNSVESISHFSEAELREAGVEAELLRDPRYVRAGGVLAEADEFDAGFFDMTAREAEITDPQHRLFLECAWEALEHAGYDAASYDGRIGVFGGVGTNRYGDRLAQNQALAETIGELQGFLGTGHDFLTTRVSYKLNLKGPSLTVQTACSTSLVAVHLACQNLLLQECDLALAGGVSIRHLQKEGYFYQEGSILSPDGHCRAFDADAKGTVGGDGAGLVVLKRLEEALADGDLIYAVIRGSAINNDGTDKIGFTAPSVDGQAAVIREALAVAGVEPATIQYIETHGTGTPLGDPIEARALQEVFQDTGDRTAPCAIGSVKTNIGHLDAAAGVTSLIKAALALRDGVLPPSLHFRNPNPAIDWANTPFEVNVELRPWESDGTPRRAGVSSFGIGGTNAHVVLEEAPRRETSAAGRSSQLLVWSAKTATALEQATERLTEHLAAHPEADLHDEAYTLQVGRRAFRHRRLLVAKGREDALQALTRRDEKRLLTAQAETRERPVVFVFPGQGTQHVNMALDLYREEDVFRETVDLCAEVLLPELGLDLRTLLYPSAGEVAEAEALLNQTRYTQPALFVIEYAIAKLWMSWGVVPSAMIGHSIGEYVAACLADVMSLPDALRLIAVRGRLMQEMPEGAMLAVPLAESALVPFLQKGVELAAVNGSQACIAAGPAKEIELLSARLAEQGVLSRRLRTSHAFHSHMMEPILNAFKEIVREVRLHSPRIPYLSNVTGTWMEAGEATDPAYWSRHLRQTVRFADGVRELLQEPGPIWLEVGPGQSYAGLIRQQASAEGQREETVLSSLPNRDEKRPQGAVLLEAYGRMWLSGARMDWSKLHAGTTRHRVPLPTYPFERKRYLVEAIESPSRRLAANVQQNQLADEENAIASRQFLEEARSPVGTVEQVIADIWSELFGVHQIGTDQNFFELGGNSLVAIQLITRLRQTFETEVPIQAIFESPTIEGLAREVSALLMTPEEMAELEQLLLGIEGLSEEELEALLDSQPDSTSTSTSTSHVALAPAPTVTSALASAQNFAQTSALAATPAPKATPSTQPLLQKRDLQFGLYFFSGDGSTSSSDKYRLLLDSAKFADEHGFAAVWTPERHFQDFGGLYPNPAVVSAALAVTTRHVQLRAGSVAIPLHHPVRVCEEWAVVDNLSQGRVAICCASGWHPSDFMLAPKRSQLEYDNRRDVMIENIQTIRQLWSGEELAFPGIDEEPVLARVLPRPIQPELPIWIASQGTEETFVRAGEIGANLLTGIVNQPLEELAAKIRLYRETREKHGHDPAAGIVTVMLHTYLGESDEDVKAKVREPMTSYLRSFLRQQESFSEFQLASETDKQTLLAFAFENYFAEGALFGTVEKCAVLLDKLAAIGVNEVANLIDFGLEADEVLKGLTYLDQLKNLYRSQSAEEVAR